MIQAASPPIMPLLPVRDLQTEAFAAVAQAAADHRELLSTERFAALLLPTGRLDRLALLSDAWFGEVIEVGTLAEHLGRVRSMAGSRTPPWTAPLAHDIEGSLCPVRRAEAEARRGQERPQRAGSVPSQNPAAWSTRDCCPHRTVPSRRGAFDRRPTP
ncbi:hypothetical protein GXW83_15740 [Streptacidiphilus sp. PB12-B1b]|uniref:hypothetical protein n=1 Tax=Streptacidiphilus sp. PB12-B1b TaxID=2705012 RepID=UPI0015FD09D0|nr:hypothetical protein [Streptacidiphilus sp. PB12-B1b]QMU76949.1 hypothetical protein GXW83_15740 [Streptacidiphilus sp. PB12-B1b]